MIAFTFPGQGSQRPAMGEPWQHDPSWELVQRASDATGRDVGRLLLSADADELKLTNNAQLSTFVLSLVVHDAVTRRGVRAAFVAGHSLGEYSALVAAGALSFDDGVRLVAERGDAMREASTQHVGTMAAVLGAEDDDVEAACAEVRVAGGEVWVANFNAPGQIVIAGSPAALEQATAAVKARGAKRVMPVAVSGAFHTPYMAPAQARLDAALAGVGFADATVPLAANVDAALHVGAGEWRDLLSRQLCSPVRWRHLLRNLAEAGVDTLVELGPGTVLTGMGKRTIEGARTMSAATPTEVLPLTDSLAEADDAPATAAELDLTEVPEVAPVPVEVGASAMVTAPTEGEHLFATERLVVSPVAGVFDPAEQLCDGAPIQVGQVVGRVGDHEVRSRFTGWVMGLLAHRGERVTPSQPVAWLRIS